MHVILLHNELCSESLILCANEHYNYTHLVEMLPLRNALRVSTIYLISFYCLILELIFVMAFIFYNIKTN